MTPCPCGCHGTVKPGNRFADKTCGPVIAAKRRRGEFPPAERRLCAWCGVMPAKRKYCDRSCAGSAAAASRTREQNEAAGRRVAELNKRKYHEKVKEAVAAACKETGAEVTPEMVEVALQTWHAGYRSGYSVAYSRVSRAAKETEAA